MSTKELIEAYYSTSAAGDWDGWLVLFDQKIVMEDLVGGHFEGIDQMKKKVDALTKGYSKFLMTPVHIVIQDDQGAVVWHFQGVTKSGVSIDTKGANYFQVQKDKIVYIADFLDTKAFEPFMTQKL